MNKIKVVGCGGIASWLLPPLCQYLNYTVRDDCDLHLVDGDIYETRNQERQVFNRNGNKAEVTAERLRAEFPNIFFTPHPVFLTDDNTVLLIRDGDTIFSCVDNHATRKLISDRSEELDNVCLISGGNDFTDGNIQVHLKREGKDLSMPVSNRFHPEISNPKDKNPGEEQVHHLSCQELVAVSPQLIFTNNRIASEMLACYYTVMMGKLKYDEVYIDLMTGNTQPKKDGKRVKLVDISKIQFED